MTPLELRDAIDRLPPKPDEETFDGCYTINDDTEWYRPPEFWKALAFADEARLALALRVIREYTETLNTLTLMPMTGDEVEVARRAFDESAKNLRTILELEQQ
jgi:hypothetical protein